MRHQSAPPVPASPEPLLKASDVMAILDCSRSFLTDHGQEMGAVKLGTLWRISRTDLDAWIARGRLAEDPMLARPEETLPAPIRTAVPIGRGAINPVTGELWSGGRR